MLNPDCKYLPILLGQIKNVKITRPVCNQIPDPGSHVESYEYSIKKSFAYV